MNTIENAVIAHESGNFDEAESIYLALLEDTPGLADAMHLLGLLYRGQRKYPEAQEYLQRAIDTAPEIGVFYNSLGGCFQDQGDFATAKKFYIQSIQRQVSSAEVYNNLAYIQIAEKDLDEAEKNLRLAIRLDQEFAPAYINLGNALLEKGEFVPAANYMQQALNLNPSSAAALAGLGRSYKGQGAYGVAVQCFRKATEKRPDFGRAFALMGECELADGRNEEARAAFEQAMSVQPELADGYEGMGDLLSAEHKLEEAIEFFRKAADKPSRRVSILRKAGKCYAQLKRHKAAIDCYKGSLQVNSPDNGLVYQLLAESLSELGERKAAIECLREASRTGHSTAANATAEAVLLEQAGMLEDAEKVADSALAQYSVTANLDLHLLKARAEIRHGHLHEAEQRLAELLQACKEPGEQAVIQFIRGLVLDRSKAYGEAAQAISESHRLRAPTSAALGDLDACIARMVQLGEWANAERFAAWPQSPPDSGGRAPCFLVGLPGSGVELLSLTLAAHSGVQVLEDRFQKAASRWDFINQGPGPSELDELDPAQQLKIRKRYWKSVNRLLPDSGEKLIVDRLPTDQTSLECIYRIFPEARVVLAGRDDQDLALEFLMSSPIAELQRTGVSSLDDFRRYATTFSALMTQYQITVPMQFWSAKLEDLLTDSRGRMENLMHHLGLKLEDAQIEVLNSGVDGVAEANWLLSPGHWKNYQDLLGAEEE